LIYIGHIVLGHVFFGSLNTFCIAPFRTSSESNFMSAPPSHDVNDLVIEAIDEPAFFGNAPTPISGEVFPQRLRFSKAIIATRLNVFEQGWFFWKNL